MVDFLQVVRLLEEESKKRRAPKMHDVLAQSASLTDLLGTELLLYSDMEALF